MANREKVIWGSRLLIVALFSLIAVIGAWLFYAHQVNQGNQLKKELSTKQEERKKIKKANLEVEQKQAATPANLETAVLDLDAEKVFQVLFQYNTWQDYYQNSIQLGQTFPKLVANPLVDTEGTNIGTSKSPISSYRIQNSFVTSEGGKIYLIKQSVSAGGVNYTKDYYLKISGTGVDLDVLEFQILKEVIAYE